MNFYTISSFREVVADLMKKPREGYSWFQISVYGIKYVG